MAKKKVDTTVTADDLTVRSLGSKDVFRVARIINRASKGTKAEVMEALFPKDEQTRLLTDTQAALVHAERTLREVYQAAKDNELDAEEIIDEVDRYIAGKANLGGNYNMDIAGIMFAMAALMDEQEAEILEFLADMAELTPEDVADGPLDLAMDILYRVYEQERNRLGDFFSRVSGLVKTNSGGS